jgi:5-formyltetrahydrofolate cyclo-ligase
MHGRQEPLVFHLWRPGEPLLPGGFKVMEPRPERPVVMPDVVLAPLLAFDRAGRRLGYGKGYYDRTLASLRRSKPDALVIGLAFALQEVAAVPADVTDERLDAVLTEAGVHLCSPRSRAAALTPDDAG